MSASTGSANASPCCTGISSRRSDGERYDLIITNPPYVDADGHGGAAAGMPARAGAGARRRPDGIDIIARIIEEAGRHLTENGGLLCEVGRGRPVLEARYPDLAFLWLDTEESTGEVFWLAACELR